MSLSNSFIKLTQAFALLCLSVNSYSQGNLSGINSLETATGVMRGITQGMRESERNEEITARLNMQAEELRMMKYKFNAEIYFQCMELQLKNKQQGIDVDLGCKKP